MDASTHPVRRIAQVPVRLGAFVAFSLWGFLSVFVLPVALIFPVVVLGSVVLALNALVALRIVVTSLGVVRVPRRTLLVATGANAWVCAAARTTDLSLVFKLGAGLSCAVSVAALLIVVGFRTPPDPVD